MWKKEETVFFKKGVFLAFGVRRPYFFSSKIFLPMLHLVSLLATLLWRRSAGKMDVSAIHSKEGNDQAKTEAVASTSSTNVTNAPATAATNSEDNSESEPDREKEKDIEILKVTDSEEDCLIDLTTLLSQEKESPTEDICRTQIVHNSPLAEYMARRKKNKNSKTDTKTVSPDSTSKFPDISLNDVVTCSKKYGGTKNQSWSEKRHYHEKSQCCVQVDENSNLGLENRELSPTIMGERRASFSLSPTFKRKMKPFTECFKDYREGCYKMPIYSETTMQPAEKRKHSSSIQEHVIVIDSSSSSEQSSPCTSRKKYKKTLTRMWEWSDFGLKYRQKRSEYPGVEFSIMSYNLLAQDLLESHPHLYANSNWEVLVWEYRRARLLEEIDEHLPDIMCLQEVQCNHYDDFLKPKLEKRGYFGIYCKKSGNQSDGCATFFKVMKFELLNFRQVFYQKGGILDRCNVGLIVSLKPKASVPNLDSSELYVANTHLLFNPRRGDVKLAQLIILFAELDKVAYKCHLNSNTVIYHPTIVCGDFNFEPFCHIYDLIASRYLHYEGLQIQEMAGMSRSYSGRDNYLTKDFFPSYLNITNSCQFAETVKERNLKEASKLLKKSSVCAEQSKNTKEKPSKSTVSDNSPKHSPQSRDISVPPGLEEMLTPMSSGEISHYFNFVSTYKHVIKHEKHFKVEVTSYHEFTCATTDYIFYNVDRTSTHSKKNRGRLGNSSVPEGRLKLLCRYGLFSREDVKKMDKLPNAEFGSDHFSLIVHFLLT